MTRRPERVVLTIGVVGILAHAFVVPERLHEVSYDAVELFVLASMLWGIHRNRPRPARPWWILAGGMALLVVGDVIYNALTRIHGQEVFPSVADAMYVASYVVFSVGLLDALRSRRHGRDRTALLDALLVTVVAGVASWVYLIDPSSFQDVSLRDGLISAAYPVGDVVLLAFLVRLLVSSSRRPPSERILAVGIGLLLVADMAYARLALTSTYAVGSWLDIVYHVSYLCFAVAAVHPTMRALSAPEPDFAPSARSRVWLLAPVSLLLPTLAVVEVASGDKKDAIVLAAASAVAFSLLTLRTSVLNASLVGALSREKDALGRERVLRALGTTLAVASDRVAICTAAVDHARMLAGDGSEALLLGADSTPPPTAVGLRSDGPDGPLDRMPVFPAAPAARLAAGRAAMIDPGCTGGLGAQLPDGWEGRPLFAIPLRAVGRPVGTVLLTPATGGGSPDRWERLLDGCDAVGSTASLALAAAELAEKLVEERSEQRFGAMIRNSSDILLVIRPEGTVRFVSPSATRMLGWEVDELLGRPIGDLVHAEDRALVTSTLQGALSEPGTHGPIGCRARHRDGSWRYLEAVGTSLLDDPAYAGVVVNIRDVTDRVRLEGELTRQAFHDPLTGLANRTLFLDRVQHAIEGASPTGSATATETEILFLDLDDFKIVNDSLGHIAGDAALVEVAERLRGCLRPTDTAARLGGDEFAVLLVGDAEAAATVAERIITDLRRPLDLGGHEVSIQASMGTTAGRGGTTGTDLLREADLAMYVAKAEGKDRWVAFRPEMLDNFLDELELERALRAAVRDDQLDVHFQPIVDLATGAISGAEALVRWVDPVRGPIGPADFIPVAERSDLIETIGRFVLHRACRSAAAWGRDHRPISHISVNVSARQLRGPGLVGEVAAILAETGLAPHKLVLEITESMLLDDLDATVDRLDELRGLGVRVAIDDFGTGYSSLSYLGRLPADVLKIDRSFTKGLNGVDDRNLVPAILEVARTLGLTTVAEGVETREQGQQLADLGCELAQGFYFARPVPEADFVEMLQRPPLTAAAWAGSTSPRRRPDPRSNRHRRGIERRGLRTPGA